MRIGDAIERRFVRGSRRFEGAAKQSCSGMNLDHAG
jgi:hypothetical protein